MTVFFLLFLQCFQSTQAQCSRWMTIRKSRNHNFHRLPLTGQYTKITHFMHLVSVIDNEYVVNNNNDLNLSENPYLQVSGYCFTQDVMTKLAEHYG